MAARNLQESAWVFYYYQKSGDNVRRRQLALYDAAGPAKTQRKQPPPIPRPFYERNGTARGTCFYPWRNAHAQCTNGDGDQKLGTNIINMHENF
jgi:hypothetical protein